MTLPSNRAGQRPGRGFQVLLVGVLALAATGYFVGLRQSRNVVPADPRHAPASPTEVDAAPQAASYAELPKIKLGPNRMWKSVLASLAQPSVSPPKQPASADAWQQAQRDRARRRAFDGAPPIIPHPASATNTTVCLACHEKGLWVENRFASKMSHPFYSQCTQCHVEAPEEATAAWASNGFIGVQWPAHGERAFPMAPPTIPHPAFMREDCQSCHGDAGASPLRTTHPDRRNCFQCHLPTSSLDRPAFLAERPEGHPAPPAIPLPTKEPLEKTP